MSINHQIRLDNTQLQADAQRASQMLKGIGNTAQAEAAKLDNQFKSIGRGFVAIGGTAALSILGKQILDTTAKFEKFGIVLKNTLGNTKGAEALDMIAHFAATTPFQLDEVTGAFIKMTNQGFTPTRNELIKLGDLASSTGKSFDQLAEAILDAQTGEFERLKEFGIKAKQSNDKITFSFKDQQTTVAKTNASIRGYILSLGELNGIQGSNALISASLTGQISNLGDKLAAMYNEIGTSNKGILNAAVSGAATLVDNYKSIGNVLMGLVATYGAYKTAVIVATVATNGLTLAESLWYAKSEALLAINKALNATMLKNPYVLATMAVLGLVGAMGLYANSIKKVKTEKELLNDIETESKKNTRSEIGEVDRLKKILNDTNKSYNERKVALDKLKEIVPDYHASLTNEGILINNNADALDSYVKKLVIAEKIKIAASKQSEAQQNFDDYKAENKDVLKSALKKEPNQRFAGEAAAIETWTKLAKEAGKYEDILEKLQSELVAIDAKTITPQKTETESEREAREAKEKKEKEKQKKNESDFEKLKLESQKKLNDEELQLLRSKITDKKDLIDLDYEQTLDAIKAEEDLYKEMAIKAGEKFPDLSIFDKRRSVAANKRVSDKVLVDKEEKDALLNQYQTYLQKIKKLDDDYKKDAVLLSGTDNLSARTEQYKNDIQTLKNELLETYGLQDLYVGQGSEFLTEKIKKAIPLFTEIADLTKTQLEEVKAIIDGIELSPEQLQTLKQAGIDVEKLVAELKKAKEASTKAIDEQNWKNILESVNTLSGSIGNLGEVLSGMGGAVGEIGAGLAELADSMSSVYTAMSSTDPMKVLSAGIDGLVKLVSMVANQIEANKKAQEEWNSKIDESVHLMAMARIEAEAYSSLNIFGVENPYSEAIAGATQYALATKLLAEQTEKLSQGKIQTGTKQVVSGQNVGAGIGAGAAVGAAVGSFIPVVGTLLGAGIGALVGGLVGVIATKTEPVFENLATKYGSILTQEGELNPELLADYDKLDEKTKKLVDNWKEVKAAQEAAQKQMEDNFKELAGDLGSSLSSALVEAFANGDLYSAIDKFDSKVNEVISGIVEQLIFSAVFGQMFTDLEEQFKNSFGANGDNNITDDLVRFNEEYKKGLEAYNEAMTAANEAMKNDGFAGFGLGDTRQATQKGFASMSQDSADELNGRFTAIQGHTFSIVESMKILQANSSQALRHLAGIETNTSRLEAVENNLVKVNNTMSSVKSGIDDINTKGVHIKG